MTYSQFTCRKKCTAINELKHKNYNSTNISLNINKILIHQSIIARHDDPTQIGGELIK